MNVGYEVTVGIPVYNVEDYIRLALDSVLGQSFPSIEVLICDDCGTDSSIDIVHEYQQNHPRGKDIRILHQPQNMGIGAGRNRMMAEAQGKYFYSLDGDDSIAPNTIELLYNAAQKYQAEIVYGSYERVFVQDGKRVGTKPYPYPMKVFSAPDEYALYVYKYGIQGMNWNYLIDLNVVRRHHLQVTPVNHGYGEDFTYTVDLPTYIDRAILLPDITYQYYIRTFTNRPRRKKILSRQQMSLSLDAISLKKQRMELKDKPYYARRCCRLMMIDCSFACEMVVKRDDFDVPFTDREIHDVMWHPMTLLEILHSHSVRGRNLLYYLIGKIPPTFSVMILRLMEKRYGVRMLK